MICSMFPESYRACHPGSGASSEQEVLSPAGAGSDPLAAAVAVAVVALAWSGLREPGLRLAAVRSTFAGLDCGWLAAAAALALATYVGRALRWAVLIAPVKPKPSLRNLLSATIIGFTAITLLGRPGEFVRPYLIAASERVPLSSQFAALMLERIYDLLMALLVFGFALSRVHASEVHAGPALGWVLETGGKVAAAVALASFLVLVLIRQFAEPMRGRMLDGLKVLPERITPSRTAGERLRAGGGVHAELARPGAAGGIHRAGVGAHCRHMLCLVRAFPALDFGLVDVLIFMGFVSFGAVVQIPGIGGGVQVVAVLVLTELFGVRLEVATCVAMLLWIVTFVIIVPAGLLLAFQEGLNWKKLKELGREVAE